MMFTRKGRQGQGQGQGGGIDAKKSGASDGGGGRREGGRYDADAAAAAAGGGAAVHAIELMGKVPGQVMDAKKPQPRYMTKGEIIKQGNLQPPCPPNHSLC